MAVDRDKIQEMSLFGRCFWFVYKLIAWTLLGWILALIISCCLLLFLGHQAGLGYVDQLLQGQLSYLDINLTRSFLVHEPVDFAVSIAHTVYQWLFVKTHFINLFSQTCSQTNSSISSLVNNETAKKIIETSYPIVSDYGRILIATTELISVKFAVIILSLPVFVLFGLVGLVDGLAQRDLRRFGGGRESSLVYHGAKRYALPIIVISSLIYIVLPLDIAPEFIFLPFAALFGFVVAMLAKTFKKHI